MIDINEKSTKADIDQQINKLKKKRDRIERYQKVSSSVALGGLIAALLIGLISLFYPNAIGKSKNDEVVAFIDSINFAKVEKIYLKNLNTYDSLLKNRIDTINNDNINRVAIVNLSNQVNQLRSQVDSLGIIILDNPQKAVAIPLLNEKIQSLKEQSAIDLKSNKEDIARVFELNKWTTGFVITLLISVIGLVLNNWFAKRNSYSLTKSTEDK